MSLREIEAESFDQVFDAPTADHGIEGKDQRAAKYGQDPGDRPAAAGRQHLEGAARRGLAAPPDDEFRQKNGQADQQHEPQIDQNEGSAAVFPYEIGETPEIAQPHGRTGQGHQHTERTAEGIARMRGR